MIVFVSTKDFSSPKIEVQSLTGAEQERFQVLDPFSYNKTRMGYCDPQGLWRGVTLGYHYDP